MSSKKTRTNFRMKALKIHWGLKCLCSISKAKLHHFEFIVILVCPAGCFVYIFFLHLNLMIPKSKINCRRIIAPCNLSRRSSIMGIGNLLFTVKELNFF